MIIFGHRATRIGSVDLYGTSCNYCEQSNSQEITVFGRYAHVFWIPMFPLGKVVVSECNHCMRTIRRNEFTPQLSRKYEEQKNRLKTPFWHWIGLIIIGLLIALISITAKSTPTDPRAKLLNRDLDSMVLNPSQQEDSIAFHIESMMELFVDEENHPERFKYAVKQKEDKILVLMKVPTLKQVRKKNRTEILDMINTSLETEEGIQGKEIYIGVEGKYTIMLLQTPKTIKNGRFISESPLYEFYGQLPLKKNKKAPPLFDKILSKLDQNKDGEVSRIEAKGILLKEFGDIDTDGNEFVTREEFEVHMIRKEKLKNNF